MRSSFLSESPCDEQHIHGYGFNPQSWLQVERGKLPKSSYSPSSIESLIKIAEPPVVPLYKPLDYVDVLSRIHEELEQCAPSERPGLYLVQSQVFRGLGEAKLRQRSLHSAWRCAITVHEKVIFGAWLRYEKRGEEIISDVLASCRKCCRECGLLDVASEMPVGNFETVGSCETGSSSQISSMVTFQIRDGRVTCDRCKIASLSIPFCSMLNGPFTESQLELVDLSENGISLEGMRAVSEFSSTCSLGDLPLEILLEILVFANTFCCDRLKDACDRKLASFVSSRQDAVELMALAFEENAPVLAAACLQMLLQELPDCLADDLVISLFLGATAQQQLIMVGQASFLLYCLLTEVAMSIDPRTDTTVCLSEKLVQLAVTPTQKQIAFHQLGCIRLLRQEYNEAERRFEVAFSAGHVYSVAGLARVAGLQGQKALAYEKLSSVITSNMPLGWMYLERSLYSEGDRKLADLDKATELDPTLTYPYMYRAASLMRKKDPKLALEEINRLLGFKLALECLELRICLYLALEDYKSAICDIHAILTLSPEYRMLEGRVAASKIGTLLGAHVEQWNTAECWLQLYERWSSVDDIGSLSVIYRMLESDAAKGVLYFRQSLLLLRLNCPEAAMRSLQLARHHAATGHERLVYEGWLLYDTGHCEEALQKAEESISIQRSFEAFFLKAYVLADSGVDPSYSATVISLLEDALKCPSDRLRKGQEFEQQFTRLGELKLEVKVWTDWANERVLQSTSRLVNERAALLSLKKDKAVEEPGVFNRKKLEETQRAIDSTSDELDRVNSLVQELTDKVSVSRSEKKAVQLQIEKSDARLANILSKQNESMNRLKSLETEKILLQDELAAETSKLSKLLESLQQARRYEVVLKKRCQDGEKKIDVLTKQINFERTELERIDTSARAKSSHLLLKARNDQEWLQASIKNLKQQVGEIEMSRSSKPLSIAKFMGPPGFMIDSVQREQECVMCLEEEVSVVFLPCRHQVVCADCNQRHRDGGMTECPSCRSPIERRICARFTDS